MSRTSQRQGSKSRYRHGESKQYGIQAVKNYRERSTAKKEKK